MSATLKSFKALGLLLTYPQEDMVAALDEIAACLIEENVIREPTRRCLWRLLDHLQHTDLLTLQEQYVGLFDRSRTLSLHLYEHLLGESRDRGPAMVNLQEVYRRHGMAVSSRELPDYLPLLCEFLSQIDAVEAGRILSDATAILETVRRRLEQRGSLYQVVFAALVDLADGAVDGAAVEAALKATPDDDGNDLEAIDRAWEEAAVTFGAGDALKGAVSCPLMPRHGAPAASPVPAA